MFAVGFEEGGGVFRGAIGGPLGWVLSGWVLVMVAWVRFWMSSQPRAMPDAGVEVGFAWQTDAGEAFAGVKTMRPVWS